MTQQEQTIFFELLRAALWEREVDLRVFQGDWSWERLLQSFHEHALLGVVAHTILNLPADCQPDVRQQQFLYQAVASFVQTHQELNQAAGEIMTLLEEAGCSPVLLKGQGLVRYYPRHCLRSCGDIDIYVGPDKMQAAIEAIERKVQAEEGTISDAHEMDHHLQFSFNGIVYELHRYPGIAGNLHYRHEYQQVAHPYLLPSQTEFVNLQTPSGSVAVRVPSSQFNSWYIFNHLLQHYREGGVGIRQFCDWLLVLKTMDGSEKFGDFAISLSTVLSQIGLKRAWQILGGVLVHQLGLPSDKFPLYDESKAKQSQGYVLQEIVEGHNFRFKSSTERYKQIPHGLHRIWSAMSEVYLIARPLSVISPFYPLSYMIYRIRFGVNGVVERRRKEFL